MRLGRDGIAGLIGLAISLVLLPYAFGLPKLPIVPIGPGFYSAIVLGFLGAMSALLVLQDIVVQRRTAVAGEGEPAGPRRAYGLVAAAFAEVAAYIFLLPLLGFRIATAVFVAVFQLGLERPATLRQWSALIGVAIGTTAVTYLVFEQYLTVLLPRGRWTGW
ncbi:MAG: tripartite tricarboxylate transporter TctB family protein [Rhodospirillales bacterium]|nr:tripartite tricarboxylate transporter TctB family protein [Rhodospirillales bacterium]